MVSLPHTNTVILQDLYCWTITEPVLQVLELLGKSRKKKRRKEKNLKNTYLTTDCTCTAVGCKSLTQGGVSYFPYILLNEIQTMFSQLAKRSAKVLPADLCTDHAHYVKIHRSTVLRRNKNMAIEGGTVSHDYILVIRKFIDFMSLFRHSVWFSFSVKQFPSAEFGICNI